MTLEEAKVKAYKFIKAVNQMKDTSNEWHGYDNNELHEIKRFTETFLKALEDSIPKDEVRKKIDELELLKKALPIRTEIPRFIDYLKELSGE